jgi:hypothetical protein
MKRVPPILLAVLCAAIAGAAAPPPGRTFYAPFDGSLEAAQAAGERAGQPEGKPEFMAGHLGQAVVVGDLGGPAAVAFPSAGNFDAERGTVSLWVMPVNWQGDDKLSHLFFQARTAGGGQYLLYKYSAVSWGAAFHLDPGEGIAAKMNIFKPIKEWRPGEWHHIAIAWTRHEAMKLYLDGALAAKSQGAGLTEQAPSGPMRFGGCWGNNGDRTALDEAMIFSRMLSDEEIAALAVEGPTTSRPAVPAPDESRDIPGVMLTHAVLGQKVLARVYDDALGEPCRQARLSLVGPDGREAAGQNMTVKPGLNEAQLDLTSLPQAVYEARVTLLREGKAAAVETLRVSKETDDT